MKKLFIAAFILTHSTSLANGLEALLKAIPEIDQVIVIRNIAHALQQVEEIQPRLFLIDSTLLANETDVFLEKIVLLSPGTQRVLLVPDVQDLKWKPQYAEAVLIEGIAPSILAGVVTSLLSNKGENHEHDSSNQ